MSCLCKSNVAFECRTCLKDLLPPIFQCSNGHLICSSCLRSTNACQATDCHENLVGLKIRNLEVENVIGILKYHCGTPEEGCPVEMNYKEYVEHKLDCPNRDMNFCYLLGIDCDEVMKRKFLPDHLIQTHDSACFRNYKMGDILEDHQGASTLNEPLEWIGPVIQHQKKIFFIKTYFNKSAISWMAVLVGSKSEANKYQVTFSINSSSKQSEYQWKGPVCGIESNFDNAMDYFSVPNEVFQPCYVTNQLGRNNFSTWKIKFRFNFLLGHVPSSPETPDPPTRDTNGESYLILKKPTCDYREATTTTSDSSSEEEVISQ